MSSPETFLAYGAIMLVIALLAVAIDWFGKPLRHRKFVPKIYRFPDERAARRGPVKRTPWSDDALVLPVSEGTLTPAVGGFPPAGGAPGAVSPGAWAPTAFSNSGRPAPTTPVVPPVDPGGPLIDPVGPSRGREPEPSAPPSFVSPYPDGAGGIASPADVDVDTDPDPDPDPDAGLDADTDVDVDTDFEVVDGVVEPESVEAESGADHTSATLDSAVESTASPQAAATEPPTSERPIVSVFEDATPHNIADTAIGGSTTITDPDSRTDGQRTSGWRPGQYVFNFTTEGKEPSPSAVRSRYWKNVGVTEGAALFGGDNVKRLQQGKAPQRRNPRSGKLESMRLPTVSFDDNFGKTPVPAWPGNDIDPFAT